jgi:hypothetical protein
LESGVILPIETLMNALPEKLNLDLNLLQPDVDESIERANQSLYDILRSRVVEQEVLNLLDEPQN